MTRRSIISLLILFVTSLSLLASVKVKDVKIESRWPWSGLVDITYSIEEDGSGTAGSIQNRYNVVFTGHDSDRNRDIVLKSLSGDGVNESVAAGGPYKVVWDAAADEADINSSSFSVAVSLRTRAAAYVVVDLVTWQIREEEHGPELSNDSCRLNELWLRQIPAGSFRMGSPANELGRQNDENVHDVTISQRFYIGVFPITQYQWLLVKGTRPSYFKDNYYLPCPVEQVSYDSIRGSSAKGGGGWPVYGHAVDKSSFLGMLRQRTGLTFDLPTEAQWEYACRAGTNTALNSGKDLVRNDYDVSMNEVGRYYFNGGHDVPDPLEKYGPAKVGKYLPNAWGLYDMHGNVFEWCLDWYGDTYESGRTVDPVGPKKNDKHVLRGGGWVCDAEQCRSAYRDFAEPSEVYPYCGFRVVLILP